MELATNGFSLSLDFLMDVAKGYLTAPTTLMAASLETEAIMLSRRSSDTDDMSFKLAEIHLSLIYDHLYTKFGGNLMAVCCRLTTFALTSIALVLFVVSTRLDHKGNTYYETADITISYILLVGAIALEISSVLLWLLSSYSPWKFIRYKQTHLIPIYITIVLHYSISCCLKQELYFCLCKLVHTHKRTRAILHPKCSYT